MNQDKYYGLIPEWASQDGVILVWPHRQSDWSSILEEAQRQTILLAKAIARFEPVYLLCPEGETPNATDLEGIIDNSLSIIIVPTNDTWIRDYGPLCKLSKQKGEKELVQFSYNGWGLKYSSNLDNQVTKELFQQSFFHPSLSIDGLYRSLILEGGGLESNGKGLLLINQYWLNAPNRNEGLSREELREKLCNLLDVEKILNVDCPPLLGDDTDGHIDTIARFIGENKIAYVAPTNSHSPNYKTLCQLEKQISELKNLQGKPFDLLPLPDRGEIKDEEGNPLPATYANFLFLNGAIVVPAYDDPSLDNEVVKLFKKEFPEKEIVSVSATTLIKWHGSIHCATIQIAKGFLSLHK